MAIFYFLAGILGNLFSAAVNFDPSVGNMAAVMGLVSGMLGSIIVNWKALAGAGMLRICLIFMIFEELPSICHSKSLFNLL